MSPTLAKQRVPKVSTESLTLVDWIQFIFQDRYDPEETLVDRQGLRVRDSFKEGIILSAKPVMSGNRILFSVFELTRQVNDPKLESELMSIHGPYKFDPTRLCAVSAGLILSQLKRGPGILLTDGRPNILYSQFGVTFICWDRIQCHIDKIHRLDRRWLPGTRVIALSDD